MKLHSVKWPPRAPGLSRTLVLLHGYGADENDLLSISHELDPRLGAISLQGPLSLGQGGRAWFNLSQTREGFSFDLEEVKRASELVLEAVEEIARESPKPILLGFSQGASMALGLALAHPELCAGVFSLSGVPPRTEGLAAPELLRGLKIFAAHGVNDPLIPIAAARANRDALVALGLAVTWREYPMGHNVSLPELEDARAWLKDVA